MLLAMLIFPSIKKLLCLLWFIHLLNKKQQHSECIVVSVYLVAFTNHYRSQCQWCGPACQHLLPMRKRGRNLELALRYCRKLHQTSWRPHQMQLGSLRLQTACHALSPRLEAKAEALQPPALATGWNTREGRSRVGHRSGSKVVVSSAPGKLCLCVGVFQDQAWLPCGLLSHWQLAPIPGWLRSLRSCTWLWMPD